MFRSFANGNAGSSPAQALTSDGTTTYTYDSQNELKTVTGATPPTLTYDPEGRLWELAAGTGATRYAYEDANALTQQDPSGTYWRRYVHGPAVDEPLVQYEGMGATTRKWLSSDERGSIIAISDDSGNVTAINRYDEYGIPQSGNSGAFQFTGQQWSPLTNVYDYKARAYRPGEGVFMQTDPIGPQDDANLYAYVPNDPINNVDPLGLQDCRADRNDATCSPVLIFGRPDVQRTNCESSICWVVTPDPIAMDPIPDMVLRIGPSPQQQSQTCTQQPFSKALSNSRVQRQISKAMQEALTTPNRGIEEDPGIFDIPSHGSEVGFNIMMGSLWTYVGATYTDYFEHSMFVRAPILQLAGTFIFVHMHESPTAAPGLSPADRRAGVNIIAVGRDQTRYCARAR